MAAKLKPRPGVNLALLPVALIQTTEINTSGARPTYAINSTLTTPAVWWLSGPYLSTKIGKLYGAPNMFSPIPQPFNESNLRNPVNQTYGTPMPNQANTQVYPVYFEESNLRNPVKQSYKNEVTRQQALKLSTNTKSFKIPSDRRSAKPLLQNSRASTYCGNSSNPTNDYGVAIQSHAEGDSTLELGSPPYHIPLFLRL